MKKIYLVLAMILLIVAFVYSVVFINYPIYKSTGEINLGLDGGVNALFSGVIANVAELILLIISLWYLSRGARKDAANPQGMTPIND